MDGRAPDGATTREQNALKLRDQWKTTFQFLGYTSCLPCSVVSSKPSTPTHEPQQAVTVRESSDADVAVVSVPNSGVDLEAVERALIVFALDATGGNRTHAARLLRLTRSALLYRLQKYGLRSINGR